MDVWYNQENRLWSWPVFETIDLDDIEESNTIDLDYYGLTDDEIRAFNEIFRGLYYETWQDYINDWD